MSTEEKIVFNSDIPINNTSQDLLRRSSFSKQLAKAILSYTSSDNFAISLCGEWGCGKTSIINMVLQEIEVLTKDTDNDEKPIIVKFNPWNYSDRDQLILQFFQTILSAMNKGGQYKNLNKLGKLLQRYSEIFAYTVYIPVIGTYTKPIKKLAEKVGGSITDIVKARGDIAVQKDMVTKALMEQKHKFIVVIDDIDRLNNNQIRLIFQLVNSLAGFPRMIYLLSFDRNVVVRALEQEQNCNGEEYLEKIIQVPFDVPKASQSLLNNVFFDKLKEIVGDVADEFFKEDYCKNVHDNCIIPFLGNIRDINRIINAYRFKYDFLRGETNWIDLLALTTLQICAPEIAEWIFKNVLSLVGSAGGLTVPNPSEEYNYYIDEFRNVYPRDPEMMMTIVQTIFPRFARITSTDVYISVNDGMLRHDQRLASPARYKPYFSLTLEDITVSKSDILASFKSFNSEDFDNFIDTLIENGHIMDYLIDVRASVRDIPENRFKFFTGKMIDTLLKLTSEKNTSDYLLSVNGICQTIIWMLFAHIGKDETYNILYNRISSSNADKFAVISKFLSRIEDELGRTPSSFLVVASVIDESQMILLEKEALKYIHTLSKSCNLLDIEGFSDIAYLWEIIDKQDYISYIKGQVENIENLPKFLKISCRCFKTGDFDGWSINKEKCTDIMGLDDIYFTLCELKNTEKFRKLSIECKEACLAFIIWFTSTDRKEDENNISLEDIYEQMPQWE